MNAIKSWMYDNKFRLTKNIVQQISIEELKHMMYRVLADVDSIQEQFKVADIAPGQKVTIIRISDFGEMCVNRVAAETVEYGEYAQYDKAVKFIYKPEGRRKLYYNWYHGDLVVVDGWIDIPDRVLFDIDDSDPMFTIKKTKFLSCDDRQYDAILEYLASQNIIPIINTYKPEIRK